MRVFVFRALFGAAFIFCLWRLLAAGFAFASALGLLASLSLLLSPAARLTALLRAPADAALRPPTSADLPRRGHAQIVLGVAIALLGAGAIVGTLAELLN